MPWQETLPMDQRTQFVADVQRGHFDMSTLCARYGVSRKTGYKWLHRYLAAGPEGLHDRSHAPHRCPHRIDDALAALLLEARRQHPRWGPAKLLHYLAPRHARVAAWPAVSTVADLLKRHGLVPRRRRRRPLVQHGVVPIATAEPNDLRTTDFKGQFRTGDGRYCYPLTIADQHTRFLLTCHGLLSTETVTAKPVFERAFQEYGLPAAIRTDNGIPFATQALHGLSYLNVWWMRLGIQHQRIHPGRPQENGAHERMHRTLKRQAVKPVQSTCARQQRRFDAFRAEYNTERPHEALEQATPASRYTSSPRPYCHRLPPITYPGHFLVKKVTTGGTIRFQRRLIYLANSLVDQPIGLEETDDGIWTIDFNTVLIGMIDERDGIVHG